MTDARVPDRWLIDRRFGQVSANEFRAFIAMLTWSVSNKTDGVILPNDVPEIRWLELSDMTAFVAAELCAELDSGWLIVDFLSTQTSRAQLEQQDRNRVNDRQRQSRHRAHKAAAQNAVTRDTTRDTARDVTRDVTRDLAGQARTGKERQGSPRQENNVSDACASKPAAHSHRTVNGASAEPYVASDRELELIRRNVERGYDQ